MKAIIQCALASALTAGCVSNDALHESPINYASLLHPPETVRVTRSEEFGYGLMFTDDWMDAEISDGGRIGEPIMLYSDQMWVKFYLPPGFDGSESEWTYRDCRYFTDKAVFPRQDVTNVIKAECGGQMPSYYQFAQDRGLLAFALGRSTDAGWSGQPDIRDFFFLVDEEFGFDAKKARNVRK